MKREFRNRLKFIERVRALLYMFSGRGALLEGKKVKEGIKI